MQIGCGLFGVLKVRSKYKRLIYDGIRERFIFLTFRQEKKRVANRICNPFCIWAGLNIFGTGSNTKRNAAGPPFLGLAGTPPAGQGKTSGTKPSGGVQRSQFLNQGIPGITERRRRNSAILNSRAWPRTLPHWGARAFV